MAESRNCPHCGAAVSNRAVACWRCCRALADVGQERLPDSRAAQPQFDEIRPGRQRPLQPGQFTLGSLMLVITLVAVCLGVGVAIPCLGVTLAIVALPALMRTAALMRNYRATFVGGTNIVDTLLTFIESLIFAVLMGVAVVLSFVAAFGVVASLFGLLGRAVEELGIIVGAIVGIIIALVTLFYSWRAFWPRRRGDPWHPSSRSALGRR